VRRVDFLFLASKSDDLFFLIYSAESKICENIFHTRLQFRAKHYSGTATRQTHGTLLKVAESPDPLRYDTADLGTVC
jgi:hypothetical protein